MVKDGLRRRITDLEREQRRAQSLGCDRATLVRGPGTDQVGTAKHLMQINYHVLEEFNYKDCNDIMYDSLYLL